MVELSLGGTQEEDPAEDPSAWVPENFTGPKEGGQHGVFPDVFKRSLGSTGKTYMGNGRDSPIVLGIHTMKTGLGGRRVLTGRVKGTVPVLVYS